MKNKIKNWLYKPNPEGVTTLDAIVIMIFAPTMMLICINLAMWLTKPEQEWIGHILFPFK